jgi:hypothetical protein
MTVNITTLTSRDAARKLSSWLGAPERNYITHVAFIFLITRLVVLVSGYVAELAFPSSTGPLAVHVAANNVWLDIGARWDSIAYLAIAKVGYAANSTAYFPLYPLAINLVDAIVNNTLIAGLLISNLSLLVALMVLYRLTEFEFNDSAAATRTVFYIAAFPTAFFFSAVYTESLFLLLLVSSMYQARRGRWVSSAFLAMLCAVTRSIGGIMAVVVGLEWLGAQGWTLRDVLQAEAWRKVWLGMRKQKWAVAAIAFIPLGLVSYMIFCQVNFNDPVAFVNAQRLWGKSGADPVGVVSSAFWLINYGEAAGQGVPWLVVLNLAVGAIFLLLSIPIWRRLGLSYAVLNAAQILFVFSFGTGGAIRYLLVSFPIFMMLGLWGRNSMLDRALLIGFSVFLGIFSAMFVNWYFVA